MNKLSLHSVLQANAKLAFIHAKKSFNAAIGLQRPSKLKPSSTHWRSQSFATFLCLYLSILSKQGLRWHVIICKGVGDRFVADLAQRHVKPMAQVNVVKQGLLPAFVGDG